MILNPSNGGSGIMLNTANAIFMNANSVQNCIIISPDPMRISVCFSPIIVAYTSVIVIAVIASAILVIGHASATINSVCIGFL
jgi:hypothetical protein